MTLSAEAIIALIALLIACVPGVRFILRRHSMFRLLWNRAEAAEFPLSGMHDLVLWYSMFAHPILPSVCGNAGVIILHST
jgi:hypothetical protein